MPARLDLQDLRAFLAIAEERSIRRASARLHVSQPPLSRQIRELERELGTLLLARTQHRVELTDAGKAYYEQIKRALEIVSGAARVATLAASGQVGQLTVGFGGSAAYSFLPHVLRTFRKRYPLVHLALEPVPTSEQLDALRKNRIDIGILIHPSSTDFPDIHIKPLLRDRMVAALPTGHRLAKKPRLSLKDLAEENFISLPASSAGGGFRTHLIDLCRKSGFVPKIVQEAPQVEPLIGLVAAGVGVAVIATIAQRIRLSEVEYRPFTDRHAVTDFVVAWRKTESATPVLAFLALAEPVRSPRPRPTETMSPAVITSPASPSSRAALGSSHRCRTR